MLLDGVSRHRARSVASEQLAKLGLTDKATNRPMNLSGGEQQRVALARAMVTQPSLVLADEPTGSLDRENSIMVAESLRDIVLSDGRSVLLVTHDPFVAAYADRILVMSDGAIVDDFSTSEASTAEAISARALKSSCPVATGPTTSTGR
ncbi:MAG: ATP-binding cassette domain-containing protein [Planctomycetota bacterium]